MNGIASELSCINTPISRRIKCGLMDSKRPKDRSNHETYGQATITHVLVFHFGIHFMVLKYNAKACPSY